MSPPRVPRTTLARVFWRCLFLQAAWNRRGMQNLGFAYAIDPALRALYPEEARREEALARHLRFFNCHPYMAAAILGGAIHHEEKVAAGAEPARSPSSTSRRCRGRSRRSATGSSGPRSGRSSARSPRSGRSSLGWPAIVATILLYNAIHLALRVRLFRAGYEKGDAIVAEIARLGLPVAADRLRACGAALCGIAAAIVVVRSAAAVSGAASGALAAIAAAAGYAALAHGARLLPTAYAAALFGAAAAVAVGRLHGSS